MVFYGYYKYDKPNIDLKYIDYYTVYLTFISIDFFKSY